MRAEEREREGRDEESERSKKDDHLEEIIR